MEKILTLLESTFTCKCFRRSLNEVNSDVSASWCNRVKRNQDLAEIFRKKFAPRKQNNDMNGALKEKPALKEFRFSISTEE